MRTVVIALLCVSCASAPVAKDEWVPTEPSPGGEPAAGPRQLQTYDVMEGVLARKAELAACTSQKEPGTTGKIVMQWSIDPAGQVTDVGVAAMSEAFAGSRLETCFAGVIRSMPFPKTVTGSTSPVLFPFKF